MTTIEQRVNVALDGDTLSIIKEIARNTKKSVSKICADFIKRKIDDDEDAYYISLIKKMGDMESRPRISAEEMRRRLDALQD
jgi:hypothetical protein